MSKVLISKEEWDQWKDNQTTQIFFKHLLDLLELHKDHLCFGGVDLQKDGPGMIGRIEILHEIAGLSYEGYLNFYKDQSE